MLRSNPVTFSFSGNAVTPRLLGVLIAGWLGLGAAWGQPSGTQVSNRQQFWSEQVLVYQLPGRFSLQLDHQYNRQASDRGTQDWHVLRLPLQQMLRPWVFYQQNETLRWGLSPLGIWWNWSQEFEDQAVGYSREICTIPELSLTPPSAGPGTRTYRLRTEFRFPSGTDSLRGEYNFRADGEAPYVRADRLNIRLRTLAEYQFPVFRREPDDERWYLEVSTEPMLVWSDDGGVQFDQNRFSLALGRRLGEHVRLELGYLSQLRYRPPGTDDPREFRFRNILMFNIQITRTSSRHHN